VRAEANASEAQRAAHAGLFGSEPPVPAAPAAPVAPAAHAAPAAAAPAAQAAPAEYEGGALQTLLAALPAADAAFVAEDAACLLFERAADDWTVGRLFCRKAVRAADGSLAFCMTFAPDEPADAAHVALAHGFDLRDLAYLREQDVRLPLRGNDKAFSVF